MDRRHARERWSPTVSAPWGTSGSACGPPVRPWRGTFADVDRAARSLAAELRARGVGPGGVVVFQLPNWVEAGITFWAAAYVGAVVVPIVHFYGAKEVEYIVRATEPDVVVTADRFGHADHLATWDEVLGRHPVPLWLVVGDTPTGDLPARGHPVRIHARRRAPRRPGGRRPRRPGDRGLHLRHDARPQGRRALAPHDRLRDPPARPLVPRPAARRRSPARPSATSSACSTPSSCRCSAPRPVNLIDVWDPGEVLRMMREEGLGVGGGATYFLTSLLDHPDFTDEHLALMPYAGLGGSTVPVAVTERATRLGITVFRSYGSTEHPSITGVPDRRPRGQAAHDRRPRRCPASSCGSTTTARS